LRYEALWSDKHDGWCVFLRTDDHPITIEFRKGPFIDELEAIKVAEHLQQEDDT